MHFLFEVFFIKKIEQNAKKTLLTEINACDCYHYYMLHQMKLGFYSLPRMIYK